jgi:hypothetical protein
MRKLAFTLLLAAILLAGALSADTLTPGSWQTFSFGLATSQAVPSYDLTVASSALLRVVDCCVIGDQFAIYINAAHAFDTSPIVNNDGDESGALDGDTAWAHPDLSKGSILLGPGVYQIDEWVIRNALGNTSGGAFIRADATTVPEPGTFGLLSLALGGLMAMLVRRRK